MKRFRKLTTLALTAVLAVSLSVPALAASIYTDTADTAALEVLSMADIIDGYADGAFHGDKVLTRAQLTKVACKLLGLTVDEKAVPAFADAKDSWAAAYIAAAYDAGVINGKTADAFAPDDPVTRNQAAMIFARMVGFDDSAIAALPWNERVEQAVSAARLDGFLTLDNGPLTRAEAADAAYAALTAKLLDPTVLSAALTANTLAGKLGFSTESGQTPDGAPAVRFVRNTMSGVSRSAFYPVADRSSLPDAAAAPAADARLLPDEDATYYGYLVGDVGEAVWQNDKVYQNFRFWDGSRTGELYTAVDVPARRPLLISFERSSDNAIVNLQFPTLTSGAIKLLEKGDFVQLADGAILAFSDETVILYIDSAAGDAESVGRPSGSLKVAKKVGGAYVDNILYTLDDDGKLACVIYDVSNTAPALLP